MLDNLIKTIPPVTRSILFVVLVGMVLIYTGYLNPYDMYFSVPKILQGQVWRLVTSLFFIKGFELSAVYQSIMFLYVSSSIEKNGFKRGSIDYLYFNLLCFGIIYALAFSFGISSLTGIYRYSLFYYFGRVHSDRLIIINFIPIRAPYCLWFMLAIEWLTGDTSLYNDLLGLLVGHCLYFMFNIYHRLGMCREGDKKFFDTPQSFITLVSPLFSAQNRARAEVGEFDEFQ